MADQAGASHTPTEHDDREYDVFLNFRGPDSRHTVADALHNALAGAGFRVFRDEEDMQIGEEIKKKLKSAIANSKIYILIFSRDYVSRKWYLLELAKMMECRKISIGETRKLILPIFYDVDVRSNSYLADLQKHRAQLGDTEVEPWEAALKEVAKIEGWNLKDHR